MNIIAKITAILLFIPTQLFCQVKDTTSVMNEIAVAEQDTMHEALSGFYVNEPNEAAMDVFTKFIVAPVSFRTVKRTAISNIADNGNIAIPKI